MRSPPRWTFWGSIEHQSDEELVTETYQALFDAGLIDVMDALEARVLGHIDGDGPDAYYREYRIVDDVTGRLRQHVETLLLELQSIALVHGWTDTMRRSAAMETVGLAGF